ncbi:MAG TPA: HNH endonuclease signature motif containing protein [Pyrinomonadaceae bacterium]|nr:HNH endonuclease signature motif containing protein [Pyrinomonadaceae bacterium]
MNSRYLPIARRAANRCEYCHAPENMFNLTFEVEHVQPQSKGGSNDESNLALTCRSCNLFKSNFVDGSDDLTQRTVSLYNPRADSWAEHFEFDLQTRHVIGRTDVGRATVKRLRMNSPKQLACRLMWIKLGLFP